MTDKPTCCPGGLAAYIKNEDGEWIHILLLGRGFPPPRFCQYCGSPLPGVMDTRIEPLRELVTKWDSVTWRDLWHDKVWRERNVSYTDAAFVFGECGAELAAALDKLDPNNKPEGK